MTPSPDTLYPHIHADQAESYRVCSICGDSKPIEAFEKNTRGIGRRWQCGKCRRARLKTAGRKKICIGCRQNILLCNFEITGKKRRQACNACRGISSNGTKRCAKCKEVKPLSDFTHVSGNANGFHSYCKNCKQALERHRSNTKAENRRLALKALYESMNESSRPAPKICGNLNCIMSEKLQPPENFDVSKIHVSGLRIYCRACELARKRTTDPKESSKEYHSRWYQEHKDELSKQTKAWREANPEHVKDKYVKRRFRQYGATLEWYETKLNEQGGCCAICGSVDAKGNGDTFHVDHDHSCCGASCRACDNCRRGLLCGPCNLMLGILENMGWVKQAKAYLDKYRREDAAGNDHPSLFDAL